MSRCRDPLGRFAPDPSSASGVRASAEESLQRAGGLGGDRHHQPLDWESLQRAEGLGAEATQCDTSYCGRNALPGYIYCAQCLARHEAAIEAGAVEIAEAEAREAEEYPYQIPFPCGCVGKWRRPVDRTIALENHYSQCAAYRRIANRLR